MRSGRDVIIAWSSGDINCIMEDWSEEKCQAWLDENSDEIIEACIRSGWDAIETLMARQEQTGK